jgi:hypothetical protein
MRGFPQPWCDEARCGKAAPFNNIFPLRRRRLRARFCSIGIAWFIRRAKDKNANRSA